MPDLIEQCSVLRAGLAALEVEALSGADCRVLSEVLACTEKALAAGRAKVAARAVACGAHRQAGYGDAAEWLARSTGTSLGQARSELKTMEALERCPATAEALGAGRVSLAQAAEIVAAQTDCPGTEDELVAVAAASGLAVLRDEARKQRLAAVDPEDLARQHHRARRFRHWRDAEGMVRFSGALAPIQGVGLMNALEAEAQRLHRAARRAGSDEPFEAHAADAMVRLCRGEAKRAGTEVVLVCDLRAWRRGHGHDGEPCHLIGGGPVPASVVREAIDDAFVKAVVHDGVQVQTVAHFGRHIPAHLRTALDLGAPPLFEGAVCTTPGCGRTFGLEYDHVDPVANGGATSQANLEPRCTPCHWEKTEADRLAGRLGRSKRGRRMARRQKKAAAAVTSAGGPEGGSGGHVPP